MKIKCYTIYTIRTIVRQYMARKLKPCQTFSNQEGCTMCLYQRQKEILNYLNKKEYATIKELANVVYTSQSSVRRDIKSLEQKGLLKQVYGGVVLPYQTSVIPLTLRDTINYSVKDSIAQIAVKHIFDGATILMDHSTTVRRIIKYINNFNQLKIITNNQQLLNECDSNKIELYSTGGKLIKQNNVLLGSAAETFLKNIYADILFFSSQAISDDGEITDICESETSIRKVMLTRAKKRIFLCDSSKLGEKKTFSLCTKDDVDVLICDKMFPWEKK